MSSMSGQKLTSWDIEDDQEDDSVQPARPKAKKNSDWAPLFLSSTFLADEPVLELDRYACKDRKLRLLGERVSRYRQAILEKAE